MLLRTIPYFVLGLDVFDDGDGLEYQFRVDGVTIKYMDLKKEYMKYHKKIPNKQRNNGGRCSWMRVKDGQTNILIEVKGLPEGEIIARVVVQRERAAYAEVKSNVFQRYLKISNVFKYLISLNYPVKCSSGRVIC